MNYEKIIASGKIFEKLKSHLPTDADIEMKFLNEYPVFIIFGKGWDDVDISYNAAFITLNPELETGGRFYISEECLVKLLKESQTITEFLTLIYDENN
jgi:hypothetical protein